MKMVILSVVLVAIGIAVATTAIIWGYKYDKAQADAVIARHNLLVNQHEDLANQHDKMHGAILDAKAAAIKAEAIASENSKKLDILLNIATNNNVDLNK